MKKINFRKIALHFTLLMIFWLVMSGMYDLFHISLGVFSAVVAIGINFKLLNHDYFSEAPDAGKGFSYFRLVYFLIYLLWQIIILALRVTLLILHPKMPIKTCISKFKVTLPNMNARVLLANSITLTPGTITVDILEDNTFIVHSLTHSDDPTWMDHSLAFAIAKLYGADVDKVISDEVIINSEDKL